MRQPSLELDSRLPVLRVGINLGHRRRLSLEELIE
jgi:hypothetical protein